MEMKMTATEDIEIGEDLTPPLRPLSAAVFDSFLSSHCSSCFSPLPSRSSHNSFNAPFYCSPVCSSAAPSLHLHSPDSSDLRATLRLRLLLPSPYPLSSDHHRIFGLLANRHKLISSPDFSEKIQRGARAIAAVEGSAGGDVSLEEALLCLVITNSVEVQDETGRSLGIAVYGAAFSWINHSCSPNACYRFSIASPNFSGESRLRLAPRAAGNEDFPVINLSRSHFLQHICID